MSIGEVKVKKSDFSILATLSSAFIKALRRIHLLSSSETAGIDKKASFIHNDLVRTFRIHIPPLIDDTVQMPLVIALHGKGVDSEGMILITRGRFDVLADRESFIVVYPDGIEMNWNDGRTDDESNDRAHQENIDDAGFISSLIDLMIKDYNVDPKRIYVTGISNGALMSYRLAFEMSSKIAAIAPVDGNLPDPLLWKDGPFEPVSVLAINNVNDPLVPFTGGEIVGNFGKVKLGKVVSTDDSIAFWANRNMCSREPVIIEEPDRDPNDGTRVIRKEYLNGKKGSEVLLYVIEGGGHTWPGGLQYLPSWKIGRTSRDIDASEVIWNFFKRHSKIL